MSIFYYRTLKLAFQVIEFPIGLLDIRSILFLLRKEREESCCISPVSLFRVRVNFTLLELFSYVFGDGLKNPATDRSVNNQARWAEKEVLNYFNSS